MLVVITQEGYFVGLLHKPTAADFERTDVVMAPENAGALTDEWRIVDGIWIAPLQVERVLPGTALAG